MQQNFTQLSLLNNCRRSVEHCAKQIASLADANAHRKDVEWIVAQYRMRNNSDHEETVDKETDQRQCAGEKANRPVEHTIDK